MIEVAYIDHMGCDDRVAEAARVSFAREASDFTRAANTRLIAFLARNGHFTPFTHPQVTLLVKAPVFVARQCMKSQVGFSVNETSRRYVDAPPEFYAPTRWRRRAEDRKQGSADVEVISVEVEPGEIASPHLLAEDCYRTCREAYEALIRGGVAPEQARMVLPQAMITSWYWTGSLAAWGRFCGLRMAEDAQAETREVAYLASEIIAPLFPISWAALAGWRPEEAAGSAA